MREMRRADRMLSQEEALKILSEGEYGLLATVNGDGQPYGVPMAYAVKDNCIYYHCTIEGGSTHDNILNNKKVSFTVVGATQVLPDKFGTLYESVIVFGEATQVDDEEEKVSAFRELLMKYCSEYMAEGEEGIKKAGPKTIVVKITINSMTGKGRKFIET